MDVTSRKNAKLRSALKQILVQTHDMSEAQADLVLGSVEADMEIQPLKTFSSQQRMTPETPTV